jgi:iron complex outermembrane receptor protein
MARHEIHRDLAAHSPSCAAMPSPLPWFHAVRWFTRVTRVVTACCCAAAAQGQTAPAPAKIAPVAPSLEAAKVLQDPPRGALILSKVVVSSEGEEEGFDTTGIGAMESEMRDAPFSNDLIAGSAGTSEVATNIETELGAIAGPAPTDLSASQTRVDVRGFPTPRLRNGFTQMGVPETINTERSEQIVGPLTPVTGRAAPGGINNLVTGRPPGRDAFAASLSASSLDALRATADRSLILVPKSLWGRASASWYQKHGPETFTAMILRTLSGSTTWKLNRASSLMFQADLSTAASRPSGGVPEYRSTRTGKVLGPYLPLAEFHNNGLNSGQKKTVGSVALQYEGQLTRQLSLRATTQYFGRRFQEQRFTRGEYLLDQGVFGGTREPLHTEMPLDVVSTAVEATLRLRVLGAEHKLLASLEGSHVRSEVEQRALEVAQRPLLLPADVLVFSPWSPNYYAPEYSRSLYTRILTDRAEITDFAAAVLSDRVAFANGRVVCTAGLRQDWVSLDVRDRRAGIAKPLVSDRTGKVSWLAGANWVALPGRLLAFANASTAFEPSLRIDARTGRIQGNESTLGYETGVTGMSPYKTLSFTAALYTYHNTNIARRNPLYGSPLYDANHTQPQLVASGGERFRGGLLEFRYTPAPEFSVSARSSFTEAITTSSPDLPEEVGRRLSRLPSTATSVSARYAPQSKRWTGLSASLAYTYIGSYVAWYESTTRAALSYPAYAQVSATLGKRWKLGKYNHSVALSVRNLLNLNLLTRLARAGGERESTIAYSVGF